MTPLRHSTNQKGMTLTELVVVCAVLVGLTGVVYSTFRYESLAYARESARSATQADLRTWSARMMKDIRNAGYDPLGTAVTSSTPAIAVATPSQFEFRTDFNRNGSFADSDAKEHLGYRLNGELLQLLQGSTWRTVVRGVTSLNVTYWNVGGTEVNQTSPYSATQDIVQVRFAISARSTDASSSFTESGAALIRNPK